MRGLAISLALVSSAAMAQPIQNCKNTSGPCYVGWIWVGPGLGANGIDVQNTGTLPIGTVNATAITIGASAVTINFGGPVVANGVLSFPAGFTSGASSSITAGTFSVGNWVFGTAASASMSSTDGTGSIVSGFGVNGQAAGTYVIGIPGQAAGLALLRYFASNTSSAVLFGSPGGGGFRFDVNQTSQMFIESGDIRLAPAAAKLIGNATSSGSAVGLTFGNNVALTMAGDIAVKFTSDNGTTTIATLDKNGLGTFNGGVTSTGNLAINGGANATGGTAIDLSGNNGQFKSTAGDVYLSGGSNKVYIQGARNIDTTGAVGLTIGSGNMTYLYLAPVVTMNSGWTSNGAELIGGNLTTTGNPTLTWGGSGLISFSGTGNIQFGGTGTFTFPTGGVTTNISITSGGLNVGGGGVTVVSTNNQYNTDDDWDFYDPVTATATVTIIAKTGPTTSSQVLKDVTFTAGIAGTGTGTETIKVANIGSCASGVYATLSIACAGAAGATTAATINTSAIPAATTLFACITGACTTANIAGNVSVHKSQ